MRKTTFDNNVQYILETEKDLKPKSCSRPKSKCTPMEWARKLVYQRVYYSNHTEEWDTYRRRWECKVK